MSRRCKCKRLGRMRGQCVVAPRFKPRELVERPWTDGTWRGPFDVVREWRRKGWDRRHRVLLSMRTLIGRNIGGSVDVSEVRRLRASTVWGLR